MDIEISFGLIRSGNHKIEKSNIAHDKKLFQNRVAQSCKEQDAYIYQYCRIVGWYGSGHSYWPVDLG